MSARKGVKDKPRVIIRIDSGIVTVVAKPVGVELEVRDYDMQDETGLKLDEGGDPYDERVY